MGSDVEGTMPIVFDIGKDKRKMEEGLEECHKQLGNNATVLYDVDYDYDYDYDYGFNREQIEKWMKAAGANWDCYHVSNFIGWEAENVITAAAGGFLLEEIT